MQAPKPESDSTDSSELAGVVARASSGDEDAWRELVQRYSRRVYALIKSRAVRDDVAQEVTQSVFVTVAEHLGRSRYTEQGRFESWLFRIAMNRLRDERRRAKRSRTQRSDFLDHEAPAPLAPQEDHDRFVQLRAALGKLSEADQEIIRLRHHADLEFRTIANLLDEPLGTVLARHHRALKKLRTLLTQQDEVPAS